MDKRLFFEASRPTNALNMQVPPFALGRLTPNVSKPSSLVRHVLSCTSGNS